MFTLSSASHRHHQGPWTQCPLVSTACLTTWCHSDLSAAFIQSLCKSLLHHSSTSSVHLLRLPLLFDLSLIPNTTCCSSQSSDILHVCPKMFSFFSIIFWTMSRVTLILLITSSFLIFRCHRMFRIHVKHFIWNTFSLSVSFFLNVQVSVAYNKTIVTRTFSSLNLVL